MHSPSRKVRERYRKCFAPSRERARQAPRRNVVGVDYWGRRGQLRHQQNVGAWTHHSCDVKGPDGDAVPGAVGWTLTVARLLRDTMFNSRTAVLGESKLFWRRLFENFKP